MQAIDFKVGDRVLVDEDVTRTLEPVEATVVEIQDNPIVGPVITVLTDEGQYFFSYVRKFRKVDSDVCRDI
jgi:hypothetical protein